MPATPAPPSSWAPAGATGAPYTDNTTMPLEPPFQIRRVGFGRVAALAEPELFGAQDPRWDWLLRQIGGNHFLWGTRHGFLPNAGTNAFWDFLVPGVGAAPVKSYLAMITVFGILIGPVNYWLLRRAGRLSMLLLTVPIGALLITCGLFTYALLVDGLGTKVYLRSFTRIDPELGMATSWSRQCYYAGMAPANGLRFSDTTAVTMIHAEDPYARDSSGWRIRWSDGNQQLAQGFLPSRTMRQFLVVHTGPADARLVLSADHRRADNRLGIPVRFLIGRLEDGSLVWAQHLPEEGEAELQPCHDRSARRDVTEFLSETSPEAPAALNVLANGGNWNQWGRSRYRASTTQLTSMTFYDSLLESGISELIGDWRALEPGEYWAVSTSRPGTVPLGVRGAEELDNLHVVSGRW
jgi:hypothetical protein